MAWSVPLPGLNPNWYLKNRLFDSKKSSYLFLIIFSNIFAMFEITEIGRKLLYDVFEPFLCIGVIMATLKLSGIRF